MPNPFNTPAKRAVREEWNTPLLRFLNIQYGFRYRYMGLPGVDLLDLKLWRDLIDEVVAFEVPVKSYGRNKDGRRNIRQLRANLSAEGFNARAYFGSMEEVILLRRDRDGLVYSQNDLVTLYNLDFCDEISSAVDTPTAGKQSWRFDAIRQILLDQKGCYDIDPSPGYFVLLLTIRDQIRVDKLLSEFSDPQADSKEYWDSCLQSHPWPANGEILGSHTWSLKTFIHDRMRKWFGAPNISALFFPMLKYEGTPIKIGSPVSKPSPMLHMMVLCWFSDRRVSNPSSLPHQFLSKATCVRADGNGILSWDPEPGEPTSVIGLPDSKAWFEQNRGPLFK